MEPWNDDELNRILRQWQAPSAPPHLEHRIFDARPWWRIFTGSVRIPIPVFALLLLAMALAWITPPRRALPAVNPPELKMSDFQPVDRLEAKVIRRSQ